jgi:prephenate dehydrogenase
MRQAAEIYRDDQFVGSHPMAGSDKSGIEYADSQLYEGRACIITPMQGKKPSQNCEKLADFWSGLGMKVGLMDAEEHDRMVASISHLPHLVSSILCHELGESQIESWLPYSGKGLWDTSRVGGGDPSMWCDIIDQNQEAILAKLRSYKEQLNHFEKLVEENKQEEIHAYLKQGQAFRRTLESIKNVND